MDKKSILQDSDVRWDERKGRPRKIRGEFILPAGDTAEDSVRAFLQSNADELGLTMGDEGLHCIQDVTTPIGTVYRFQQRHDGIPVFGTEILVRVGNDGRVKELNLEHVSPVRVISTAGDEGTLTTESTTLAAREAVGEHNLRQTIDSPEQVYYPTADGLKQAHVVLILTKDPVHDWRVIVDAQTGEILEKEDLIVEIPDGQGLVFDPNPVVTSNNNALRDPDATNASCGFAGSPRATIDAQRVTRTLRDITQSGSNYRLEGPYVRILNSPQETNANNFNYSSGDNNNRFEAVNSYYHIDTIQRYIQSIGISTAHNSQIDVDPDAAQTGGSYSSADDTIRLGHSGPCQPDRGEDGEVMLHEYGHAIQHDQVPGWGQQNPTTGRRETRAMGEGFGDILACVYLAPDHPFQREVFEDWIFGDVGGLRRVDGTKVYPTDWVHQEHGDGEIWSAALWNIYRPIGGDSMNVAERRAARDALLKTVILSHHSVAANATMPDAAEAVMETNASLDDYRGAHLMEMLDSFHDRGILRVDSGSDLYIRDASDDPGVDHYTGSRFWDSPDLWIRNADDGGTTHQNPEFGQDNWFYARVRNRGTGPARTFVVTFNVKQFAGTQFVYPGDFLPCLNAAVGFNLEAGASTIVKAKWPVALVPSAGTHTCLLASVYTPTDVSLTGRHVWEHNNLAQKNLMIVDLLPNDAVVIPFQLGSRFQIERERYRIEVRRPQNWSRLPVSIVHSNPDVVRMLFRSIEEIGVAPTVRPVQPRPILRFLEPSRVEISHRGLAVDPVRLNLSPDSTLDIGGEAEPEVMDDGFTDRGREADLVTDRTGAASIAFRPGVLTGFPIALTPRSQINVGLKIAAPPEAKPGDVVDVDLVQRNREGQVVGGITVQVNIM